FIFFFFFQAEDGIRDYKVTGVQTCALPISWAGQRDNFYDPKMHGVDWTAVRKTYAPLIEGARTPDEMRRLLRLMVGELNSSHSGDRKSTRLNSSHLVISYAVFCLKKKTRDSEGHAARVDSRVQLLRVVARQYSRRHG